MPAEDCDAYRALVERSPAMMWRASRGSRRDYFNGPWLAFTGRSLDDAVRDGWLAAVHPEDRTRCHATVLDHFERRQRFALEYRLRRSDGVYRAVLDQGAPQADAQGAFVGFLGCCVELDGRSNSAAEELEDFFTMSLDNVCVAGFDGYFKRVSPSWTETLGWTAEELMAKPLIEVVHPDDREATLAGRSRLKQGQAMGPLINRYLCKDGTFRWFEWRSVAHGDRGLVYAVARDITEQKLAEERLREAQEQQATLQRQLLFADRMTSVGTLAAGAAHEINNPLAYVTTNITLLREALDNAHASGEPLDAAQCGRLREMAAEAETGAERIRKVVRGLKSFSRVDQERRTTVEVAPVLQLSINMTHNEIRHRARLVTTFGPTPPVEADEARLGQVFINLLINAAQALPDDGATMNEIRIATSTDASGRALVEISDSGRGIPPELLERIFDPFFTTKPVGVGTGLGLSICHSIVTGLGGDIAISSEEGCGTTIRVALPASARRGEVSVAPAPPVNDSIQTGTVLVVDDELAIGRALIRVLRAHDVTAVTTAREALELLASGKRFDVILSDLMMPEMSGMELHRALQEGFPDMVERMVFISGGAFTPAAQAFLDGVPNQRLEKPFDPAIVRATVQGLLKG